MFELKKKKNDNVYFYLLLENEIYFPYDSKNLKKKSWKSLKILLEKTYSKKIKLCFFDLVQILYKFCTNLVLIWY